MVTVEQFLSAYTHEMLLGAVLGAALWIQFVYRQNHARDEEYTVVLALLAITVGGFSTLYVMPALITSSGLGLVGRGGNVLSYALITGGLLMTADTVVDRVGAG